MTLREAINAVVQQESLNFLLTNRIPRRWLTIFIGRFSKIEIGWIRDLSIAIWKMFSDLDLRDAEKKKFTSLHDCFTRELKIGARPVDRDPGIISSPCDAIVGASGRVHSGMAFQAKGFPYSLHDLLYQDLASPYCEGTFATLRLTSGMYHRFHAPAKCRVRRVKYISGDTWNVNPIALRRIENLFCKNERAIIPCETVDGQTIVLVPIAAILVASIRLHFANVLLHLNYRGPNEIPCDATFSKGEEMGWFEHGSTIIVFAPPGFDLHISVRPGFAIRMGQPLLTRPHTS